MKVLVTGGAGFIGSHLVDKLVEIGCEVRVLDNLWKQVHTGGTPDYVNPHAEYVFEDIRDYDHVSFAIKDVDVIYHLAAAVGVGQSMYQLRHYTDVNVGGTANLLQAIINSKNKPQKIIVASSMSNYGEGSYFCEECDEHPVFLNRDLEAMRCGNFNSMCPVCAGDLKAVPTNESKVMVPASIYAITKRTQEEMVLNIGEAYNIPAIALRYFNTYRPRQSLSNPYTGVVAIFLSCLKDGGCPVIFEDGGQQRDFVYVKDVVKASILAMERENVIGVFNVGTSVATPVLQLCMDLMEVVIGRDLEIPVDILYKVREGDIRSCFADIMKASVLLGYKPSYPLAIGLKELVEWSEGKSANDMVDNAVRELESRGLTK